MNHLCLYELTTILVPVSDANFLMIHFALSGILSHVTISEPTPFKNSSAEYTSFLPNKRLHTSALGISNASLIRLCPGARTVFDVANRTIFANLGFSSPIISRPRGLSPKTIPSIYFLFLNLLFSLLKTCPCRLKILAKSLPSALPDSLVRLFAGSDKLLFINLCISFFN